MLESILAGFAAYYVVLYIVHLLVGMNAINGTLIAFAVMCFIGAYFARSSRFVHRMAMILGGISVALALVAILVVPLLQGSGTGWVVTLAILAGIIVYAVTRRFWYRRLFRRDDEGNLPEVPFGREWVRWLIFFLA